MQLKPNIDLSGAAVVTLAAREYFIPTLAVRQNRVVVPALAKALPALALVESDHSAFSTDVFDALTDIVHSALTRAYDVTRDEVLDMEITPAEFGAAALVAGRQSGLFKPSSDGAPSGEANGVPATPPTSTASSPDIANIPASPGPTPSNPN